MTGTYQYLGKDFEAKIIALEETRIKYTESNKELQVRKIKIEVCLELDEERRTLGSRQAEGSDGGGGGLGLSKFGWRTHPCSPQSTATTVRSLTFGLSEGEALYQNYGTVGH
eukprot:gene27103-biopygen6685